MSREEKKFPWSMQETIENLKDLKVILQEQLKKKNYEGQGDRDVKEIALDFDRAIESLEKQIPKKPIIKRFGTDLDVECPNCGLQVCMDSSSEYNYCQNCGIKFDWTEEGDKQ